MSVCVCVCVCSQGAINDSHVLIVSVDHYPSSAGMPPSTYTEVCSQYLEDMMHHRQQDSTGGRRVANPHRLQDITGLRAIKG